MALRDWAASEVTLHGIGLELDGKPNDAVLLRVKNVMGMEDGDYEIAVPAIDGRSIVLAGDGVLETQPFQELQLASNSGGPGFTATTYMWSWGERDISDARTPLEPGPDDAEAPVSAFSNSAPGLSGGGRPIALVGLPVTLAYDIITFPIAVLITLFVSAGE